MRKGEKERETQKWNEENSAAAVNAASRAERAPLKPSSPLCENVPHRLVDAVGGGPDGDATVQQIPLALIRSTDVSFV